MRVRITAACAVLCVGIGTGFCQTAKDTLEWLDSFTTSRSGMGYYLFQEDGIRDTSGYNRKILYNKVKSVELLHYSGAETYFVRVTGQIDQRAGVYQGKDGLYYMTGCNSEQVFFDLGLRDIPDHASTQRVMNAIKHLAELAGAHPNAQEPF